MVTEMKPTFATFAKWRNYPIYMVLLVKIMDNTMLMRMRMRMSITCQSFCSLSTMVVLRWASLIWKTKNSAQTLTSTSRRSSPRRSSPWDIFNRNCHNLCRILPAQVIKLLHVPILWMRPDFQWCHKKKSIKLAREAQAKTPHAQPKPVSIINGREFHRSQETLDCKAKQLRHQGKGKLPNKAQAYTQTEEVFWSHGTLGDHNGTALTNVNFKNLTEIMGMRGRQAHYDAFIEDFNISCQADGSKVVKFKETSTKTRQDGLRNPTRHSLSGYEPGKSMMHGGRRRCFVRTVGAICSVRKRSFVPNVVQVRLM